jgi:hypothetical protein
MQMRALCTIADAVRIKFASTSKPRRGIENESIVGRPLELVADAWSIAKHSRKTSENIHRHLASNFQ